MAANHGFHVLSLKYPNGITAQGACGDNPDSNCYLNFRKEIIEGEDFSPEVSVDLPNSIYNRLIKLLKYLNNNYPAQNWDNYFSGENINWGKIIISGHSQGGGHAAVIAKDHPVKRVLMFASPNDYSTFFDAAAPWTDAPHATADSVYYGFNNLYDDVVNFSEQFEIWENLGMSLFGDSVEVEQTLYPFSNSRQLHTSRQSSGIGGNHSIMILDSKTPLDDLGKPVFESVWKYMLGIPLNTSATNSDFFSTKKISFYPNPVNDVFFIKFDFTPSEKYSVLVFDTLGKFQISFLDTQQDVIKIDTSDFKAGVYFVEFRLGNEVILTKKIVKLK